MRLGRFLMMMAATALWAAALPASAVAAGNPSEAGVLGPMELHPSLAPAVASPPIPEESLQAEQVPPVRLAIVDEPESVYPQVIAAEPREPMNAGSVHFDLDVLYLTRYVFRGVDQATIRGRSENSLQFNLAAEFDLGKIPHPFIGLFVNVFNQDPVARFEEVRPLVGLNWTIKPLTIEGAYQSFIFPNQKELDAQEIWLRLTLDDSRLWNRDRPMLSPYVFAAYDFTRYYGFYLETGLKHDFHIEDTGITLTPSASVAYVAQDRYFRRTGSTADTGFQHFEVGLTATYSLNNLLNIPRRFGQFNLKGYLFDSQPIERKLRADTRLYGGGGIDFQY